MELQQFILELQDFLALNPTTLLLIQRGPLAAPVTRVELFRFHLEDVPQIVIHS